MQECSGESAKMESMVVLEGKTTFFASDDRVSLLGGRRGHLSTLC